MKTPLRQHTQPQACYLQGDTQAVKFAALVLAGGQSRRMGTNKALLQAQPGGPTLIEIVVERVWQAGAQEVLIIANKSEPYEFLDLPIIEDEVKGAGPLGGILAGLRVSTREQNLVVACDMPNINPLLIQHMVALTGEYDVVVPRWVDRAKSVYLEPLHAIYSQTSMPKLEACAKAGVFALHSCIRVLCVRYFEDADLAPFGNPTTIFQNMNDPEDWSSFADEQLI